MRYPPGSPQTALGPSLGQRQIPRSGTIPFQNEILHAFGIADGRAGHEGPAITIGSDPTPVRRCWT